MKYITSLMLILWLSMCTKPEQSASLDKKQLLSEWNKIDDFGKKLLRRYPDFSFAASLLYKDKIISEKNFPIVNNSKTIYQWQSISKIVTSIAILQLAEQGKLKIDDPITKYIPELREASKLWGGLNQVSIHHLVNYCSNIRWDGLQQQLPLKQEVEKIPPLLKNLVLRKKSIDNPKEAVCSLKDYRQNKGDYILLGMIIERVSEQKLQDYITAHVLKPLDMQTARYAPPRLNTDNNLTASIEDVLKLVNFLKLQETKNSETVLAKETIKKFYQVSEENKFGSKGMFLTTFGLIHQLDRVNDTVLLADNETQNQTLISFGMDTPIKVVITAQFPKSQGFQEQAILSLFMNNIIGFSTSHKIKTFPNLN